jgi:hypothetical protein
MNNRNPIDEILQEVAAIWQASGGQITWHDSSFDWIPGSHRVCVRAHQKDGDSRDRVRLWITTDFLQNVPVEKKGFRRLLGASAHFMTSTYSLVYPPEPIWKEYYGGQGAELSLFSTSYISQQTISWLPRFMAQMTIMQPIDAEIRSKTAPGMFGGGTPAYATGARAPECDEILEVASSIYVPHGLKPSRWIGSEEFEKFVKEYGRSEGCYGNGDEAGLTLETPFGKHSALIRLRTDIAHPQLKNGLLVTTRIPFRLTQEQSTDEAAFLNFLESRSWTDFPQLGCWHSRSTSENQAELAHTSFIPNALYSPGLAFNFALWSVARAQWVRRERWPDLTDLTMSEILEARLGSG